MNVIEFIRKESSKPLRSILSMAVVAGLANAMVLTIINSASKKVSADEGSTQQLIMFIIVVVLYVVAQKYNMANGMAFIEDIIHNIRGRLADKVRRADLLKLEQIGEAEIYNRLTQESNVISQFALPIVTAVQSAVMLIVVLGYILTLSVVAFVIVVVFNAIAIVIYLHRAKQLAPMLVEINKTEIGFFKALTDILEGIKEVKLRKSRSNALAAFIKKISEELKEIKERIGGKYAENIIFPNAAYMLLMGAVVFILPRFSQTYKDVVTDITVAILFMFGPVGNLVGLMPLLDKVRMALSYIYELEAQLDKSVELHEAQANGEPVESNGFKNIRFEEVSFRYHSDDGKEAFQLGPISLNVRAGETIFLIGGNGCGKTTLLKLLTMLYFPRQGTVFVDDKQIEQANVLRYREMFSAIFSDFHLFLKLYGMEDIDPAKVQELLRFMEIDKKTQYRDGGFTDIDLSTGQRKRLAMVVALLEDRPICVFDEWAADQDPHFRNIFYEDILKGLKKQGKTVIAVSHDDRYYKYADRVIKMEYGTIISDEKLKKK
ncbi:MAG TPA: cyclic peptide export ABC transporter [Bacteroidota bacterium]|nr:cyclic peptide export ABC transporter [Bacteroidota bacterium]